MAVEVTRKSFDWVLPMNTDLEIYALVNYSSLAGLGISLNDPNLKRATWTTWSSPVRRYRPSPTSRKAGFR